MNSFRSMGVRLFRKGLSAFMAGYLAVWLSLVTVHVQHQFGFAFPAFVDDWQWQALVNQLACKTPFPLERPTSNDDHSLPPECPIFELWSSWNPTLAKASLTSFATPQYPFPPVVFREFPHIDQEAWLVNRPMRAPPEFSVYPN